MIVRRLLATTAAVAGLLSSSVALGATPSAPVDARASAPAGDSEIGANIAGTTFINIAILIAISITLVLVVDNGGGSDSPNSP